MDTYEELGGEYMLQVEATDLIVEDGVITGRTRYRSRRHQLYDQR